MKFFIMYIGLVFLLGFGAITSLALTIMVGVNLGLLTTANGAAPDYWGAFWFGGPTFSMLILFCTYSKYLNMKHDSASITQQQKEAEP